MKYSEIIKPTLLINKNICRNNISKMAEKAIRHGLNFRPHFKTHQSAITGSWFRDYNVKSITVSSVDMAIYFNANGWKDITIAFPVNLRETEKIDDLKKSIKVNLLIDNSDSLKYLENKLSGSCGIFIKINTGYNRAGVDAENFNLLDQLAENLRKSKKLSFRGFLVHSGNTYSAKSEEEIRKISFNSFNKLINLKKRYAHLFDDIIVSIGDTPSCSLLEDFPGVDEIRPGNFIFYDLMQYEIGSCAFNEIAVCLVCPVVSVYPERSEAIIYGGAVHLSKDYIFMNNQKTYGLVTSINDTGWSRPIKNAYVRSLSQEHGIIKMDKKDLINIQPGNLLGIIPVHSCFTVSCMKTYYTLQGEKINLF